MIKKLITKHGSLIALVLTLFIAVPLTFTVATSPKPKQLFSQAATFDPTTRTFLETFDYSSKNPDGTFSPHTPKDFFNDHWYVMYTGSEDLWGREDIVYVPMNADHDMNCDKPPLTHRTTGHVEDAVFLCRDHMMSAYESGGDGYIDFVPDHMVDISQGTATIRFDVSTARHSDRDWLEFLISPMANHQPQAGSGGSMSTNTIRLKQLSDNHNSCWEVSYDTTSGGPNLTKGCYAEIMQGGVMAPSAEKRTTFEMRISKTSFWFGIPGGQTDINAKPINNGNELTIASGSVSIPWNNAVFDMRHGSYNPYKDESNCFQNICGPNTWHWDNVKISPAIPFTMIKPDKRRVGPPTGVTQINFPQPAPANSYLKYTAWLNPQFSTNGGQTWITPNLVPFWLAGDANPVFVNGEWSGAFYTPIPAGTTKVMFRAKNGGSDNQWIVRDPVIWSTTVGPSPTPCVGSGCPTATPTPTSSPSPTPSPTPTPAPPGAVTIDFNNFNQGNLTGQNPQGVANWVSGFEVVAPWNQYTTNNLGLLSATTTTGTFGLVQPRAVTSIQALNGGTVASTIALSCPGNPTKTQVVAVNELVTITTGWTNPCSGNVTLTSSNGWNTNFDNLVLTPVFGSGSPTPTGTAKLGDVNRDGLVNLADYTILFENYGKPSPLPDPRADLNGDSKVNVLDYSILFENFGK